MVGLWGCWCLCFSVVLLYLIVRLLLLRVYCLVGADCLVGFVVAFV